jgi:hypothetical protein
MIYQEHGHRGIWSMSIAAVERILTIQTDMDVDIGIDIAIAIDPNISDKIQL